VGLGAPNGPDNSGQGSQPRLDCRETGGEVIDSRVHVRHGGEQRRHVSFELREPVRLITHLFREQIQPVVMLRVHLPRFITELAHLRAKLDQRL
jgi:hypothetical protein